MASIRKERVMVFVSLLILLTGISTVSSQVNDSGSGEDELSDLSTEDLILPTSSIIEISNVQSSSSLFNIISSSVIQPATSSSQTMSSFDSQSLSLSQSTIIISESVTSSQLLSITSTNVITLIDSSSSVIPMVTTSMMVTTDQPIPSPTPDFSVTVASDGTVTVASPTPDGTVTVASLTTDGSVTVASDGTVTVASLTTDGTVTVASPTPDGSVTVASDGTVTVASPTPDGTVTVDGSVTVASPTPSVSNDPSITPTSTSSSSSSSSSSIISSITIPTETGGAGILDQLEDFFQNPTITLVVAIGGTCIIILLLAIIIFCCCCFCRRRKGRYTVEGESSDDGRVTGNRYRRRHPTISDPIPSYKMALRNVQEQRQQIDDFVETELGPDSSIDDNIHYQGHSQVQHSQPYSPLSEAGTTQSLSKLTPFNPSQIISQARGGISVDDDIEEEEVPQKDDYKRRGSRDNREDGTDSPFMHMSDNLTGSRGRISQQSSSDPHTDLIGQPSQASQYSHLGLGVLHGGDVVFTNTASLADDIHSSLGMIGIDTSLLISKESDLHNHRTASPLLLDTSGADLDDTPVREKSVDNHKITSKYDKGKKVKNLTMLTSLTSVEPTKLPRSSTPTDETSREMGMKLNLSSITALSTSGNKDKLTRSTTVANSDLQETPERQRRHTVDATAFKRPPSSRNQSKLGKLTSLEFIRASLRMRLNRIKGNEASDNDTRRTKPLKSALRKPSVVSNSQNSSPDSTNSSRNNSFVYSNHHALAHYSDVSPQHQLPSPHYYSQDPYMRPPNLDDYPMMGLDGYGSIPNMYPPGPGYPRGDPYMMALSPQGYAPELLSPILSVSQYDHPGMYGPHEIGILPQYGGMGAMMGGGYHDQAFPPHPPHYDDDDDDDGIPALHSPYRPGDQEGGASQRNVTWNLDPVQIHVDPENLTPSDLGDDDL